MSAADLSLVLYVCRSVDSAVVFSESPCPLSQPVLLSLIQQLSANFDSDVELKHRSASVSHVSAVLVMKYIFVIYPAVSIVSSCLLKIQTRGTKVGLT